MKKIMGDKRDRYKKGKRKSKKEEVYLQSRRIDSFCNNRYNQYFAIEAKMNASDPATDSQNSH